MSTIRIIIEYSEKHTKFNEMGRLKNPEKRIFD